MKLPVLNGKNISLVSGLRMRQGDRRQSFSSEPTFGRRKLGRVNREQYQSTVISLWVSVNISIDRYGDE
jgi:hypothetical protein